jgi:multisubunit Na+/H+ antiporter MnhC subunit
MAAELETMEHPMESLAWSLGCAGVFLRQVMWHFCTGACRGAWFWITAKDQNMNVRKARTIAVVSLLVAFAFFLLPSFRQAMSLVGDTLDGAPWARRVPKNRSQQQAPDARMISAEQQHDARMLAYLATREESDELAGQAADQAVAIDPQYTWVYYVLAGRDMAEDMLRPPTPRFSTWIEKLRQWDPQNAASYLLEARRIEQLEIANASGRTPAEKLRYVYKHTTENKLWVETMARAFDMPKYDAYTRQRFELERDIARQRGTNPLRLIVDNAGHPFPNFMDIVRYARFASTSATDPSELATQSRRVIRFGERMMASETNIERLIGYSVALVGYRKLQSVAGPEEQAFAVERIALLESAKPNANDFETPLVNALVLNAMVVDLCFVVILLGVLIIAGSTAIRLFRRSPITAGSSLVSITAVTMLVACITAFVAYVPYARLAAEAMDPHTPVNVSLTLLNSFASFVAVVKLLTTSGSAGIYLWSIVPLLLMLWIYLRHFRRPRPQTPLVSAP